MTATPKETKYISNIDYFGKPIYTYSLREGIEDGFLAPFKVINIHINISEGWRPFKGQVDKNGVLIPDRVYANSDYDYNIAVANVNNVLIPLPPIPEQRRIVAKIEELLPLIDRYEKAWTRLEDFNKRFPADMQKSILQLAIQGKLVEQRPEEGTGEELYRQIQKEKQALIKAGKIKKEKPLPEITDDEIPFDIPDEWKWVRLGEIILGVADGPHFSPKYFDNGIPFISTRNVASGKLDFTSAKYISPELHEELCKRCKPQKWDILYTKGCVRQPKSGALGLSYL